MNEDTHMTSYLTFGVVVLFFAWVYFFGNWLTTKMYRPSELRGAADQIEAGKAGAFFAIIITVAVVAACLWIFSFFQF